MGRRAIVIVVGVAGLLGLAVVVFGLRGDAEIRRQLIGTWIVPSDSSDYGRFNALSRETFRRNGTYVVHAFEDRDCGKPARAVKVKWFVMFGILISIDGTGHVMRDFVIGIDDKRMTLHSLDDGTTYTRKRVTSCKIDAGCEFAQTEAIAEGLSEGMPFDDVLARVRAQSKSLVLSYPQWRAAKLISEADAAGDGHNATIVIGAGGSQGWLVSETELLTLMFDGNGLLRTASCKMAYTGP